ncbi:hypothetical protein [Fodinicurvata sediminis]|uniref:hypothetical protein n=1 Tax=Fodinicurvata sediminis TaxID=1121832 RepID=UPI0003B63E25|nr:hypothetical protein [Fodinicurvata sediminis]
MAAISGVTKSNALEDEGEGQQEDEAARERRLREKLTAIVGRLDKEAEDRVGKRQEVEQRWLEDLRQFHGKYEDSVLKNLSENDKSKLYINKTRAKTNSMEARLSDMLFPTDDKNWGVRPTPVPELTVEAEQAAQKAAEAKQQAAEAQQQGPQPAQEGAPGQSVPGQGAAPGAGTPPQEQMQQRLQQEADAAESKAADLRRQMEEARKRARHMEEEIDDHLRECQYNIQARDVIRDACQAGTGIMKGPVVGGRKRRTWQQREVTGESGQTMTVHEMQEVEDPRPRYWRVDYWNFFPDMDARNIDDCEGIFERHLMNPKALRKLAREPGFSDDAIRRLLKDTPRNSIPTYLSDLRSITGAHHDNMSDRYHVWEYHGPLEAEELQTLAQALDQPEILEDIGEDPDPLQEIEVVIWFCQGEVLKFGLHHLDSGDQIYSVFCLEKDDASIFGFGVPYLMRDSQKALNAAWRTMMDNSGLSSGPQIIVNREVVQPANGKWTLEPRKLWYRDSSGPANQPAFETYHINSMQQEMANIIELASRNIDEETSMPIIAQGEQGSHTTQTAQGMSILMNATNVVFRRIVKNWDDDMTTPNIRRIYDFLMQFSQKEHIKGDYEVDARGTSVLLVREMQSANLMAVLSNFSAHPTLSIFFKHGGLPMMRRLMQTMMLPADEVLKTEEELAQEAAAAAEQPEDTDPKILEIESRMNLAEMEGKIKLELANIERETKMMELAAQQNMTLEQLRAKLAEGEAERASKERIFASEAAVEERRDLRGSDVQSGGYL